MHTQICMDFDCPWPLVSSLHLRHCATGFVIHSEAGDEKAEAVRGLASRLVNSMQSVTRRKLQTPGNAEEHNRQDHLQSTQSAQPTNPTGQAQSPTESTARETHTTNKHSSRARFSTTTTHHQDPHPTGSSPDLLSQRSPLRRPGAIQAGWLRRRAGRGGRLSRTTP